MQYCEDCIHCNKQIFPYICKEAQKRGIEYFRCESIRARQEFGSCFMYSYGKTQKVKYSIRVNCDFGGSNEE